MIMARPDELHRTCCLLFDSATSHHSLHTPIKSITPRILASHLLEDNSVHATGVNCTKKLNIEPGSSPKDCFFVV